MHHLDWYHQQQEKKKHHMKSNEISLINQELKRLLQRVQSFINREDYEKEARKWGRYVVQSIIWDVSYRNNMESEHVALAQAVLIQTIINKEKDIQHGRAIETEVDRLMKRLGNVVFSIYTTYRREIQHL